VKRKNENILTRIPIDAADRNLSRKGIGIKSEKPAISFFSSMQH
jgi:hypothetical protein